MRVQRVVEHLDGVEVAVEAGHERHRAAGMDLENRAAPVRIGDRLQERKPAPHVGAATEQDLQHPQLVVGRLAQPFGVDETEVLEHVVSGARNKQIAQALGISEVTVKAHRAQAMQKLDAGSLADVVRMAGKVGIDTKV